MDKYTVDRFEGDKAILLLRKDESVQRDVDRKLLPSQTKEGDILNIEFKEKDDLKAEILKQETSEAKQRAEKMIAKLLRKNQ